MKNFVQRKKKKKKMMKQKFQTPSSPKCLEVKNLGEQKKW